MTTDLSQLHPHKDFSSPKPTKVWPIWLVVGTAALAASGYAAFRTLPAAVSSPNADTRLTAPAPQPEGGELAQVSQVVFAEDSEDSEDSEHSDSEPSIKAPVTEAPEAIAPAVVATSDALEQPGATPEVDGLQADSVQPARLGAYYVQLASYRTKETADEHAGKLNARGLAAQSVAYGGPEAGWWHAVRMGPFDTRAAAEARRFDLDIQDRQSAYVLPRSNGKFHVQVASFSAPEEAEQVAKRFSRDGHVTKVTRVKMSGSYWHCVRIGPFDTREEALSYKKLVADVPGSESTVIPFGPPQQP